MSVVVKNMLKFSYYGLAAKFVVVKGLGEEMIALGLEVQKILWKDKERAFNLRLS